MSISIAQADSRRRVKIAIGVVAILGVGISTVCAWRISRGPAVPPANADVATIASFVASPDFDRANESQKRQLARQLRKRSGELAEAFRRGQITQPVYEAGSLCAWMDHELDHMEKYYHEPAARRAQYLAEEHALKLRSSNQTSPTTGPALSNSAQRHFVERWSKSWAAEQSQEWDAYRDAVKKVKAAATRSS